jgi:hypothetical protein
MRASFPACAGAASRHKSGSVRAFGPTSTVAA